MGSIFSGFRICAAVTALAALLCLGLAYADAGTPSTSKDSRRPSVRIVGGERAASGRSPWMVALGDGRVPGGREAIFCGGALVAPDWVVTAEHCIWGLSRERIEVYPGAFDLRSDRGDGIGLKGIRRSGTPSLDIALLHLEKRSKRSLLEVADRPPTPGSVATALGWGTLGEGRPAVNRLRQVELEVRSPEECRSVYFGVFDPDTMLCAGSQGRDTCYGDSGGPLVFEGRLIGITSFGRGCGRWPGVYTRIDGLAGWIGTVIERELIRHRQTTLRVRKLAKARKAKARAAARAKARAQAKR